MKATYKYPIEVSDTQSIAMPEDAQILCVQCQRGQPFILALVDTDNHSTYRQFGLVGTGHPVGCIEGGKYVGTFQLSEGSLVFHLFDLGQAMHELNMRWYMAGADQPHLVRLLTWLTKGGAVRGVLPEQMTRYKLLAELNWRVNPHEFDQGMYRQ